MADSNVRSREARLDFDEDALEAIAEVYQEEGDKEFTRNEVCNAIYFYTQGIQVNCKDVPLNAKLYCSRATAYYHLGNFHEALNDATAAVKLEPASIKALETGACTCEKFQCYEDATSWCEKGLAIDKTNKTLLHLQARCVGDRIQLQEAKSNPETHFINGQVEQTKARKWKKASEDYQKHVLDEELKSKLSQLKDLRVELREMYKNLREQCSMVKKAIEYHERHLKIAKEVGDRAGEGKSYCNLGNAYYSLGDFKKAIEYHERHLKIAKEVGDRAGEGSSYGNLGNAYYSLGDFKKAIEYHERHLKIVKEVGDRAGEGSSYCNLGICLESQGSLKKALECYCSSVRLFNDVRQNLQGKDEWAISYRDIHDVAYIRSWRLMLKQGYVFEALFAVDEGRAQALNDLLNSKHETEGPPSEAKLNFDTLYCLPSNTVFMAIHEREIIFWIIENGKHVHLRRKEISHYNSEDFATALLESLIHSVRVDIGVRSGVKCTGHLMDKKSGFESSKKKNDETFSQQRHFEGNHLRTCYDVIISPIKDLFNGDELIFVPEGPLCLAPYAAFLDSNSKYLSESFRIRVIPSLNSLKLIKDCSPDYHKKSGVLLVGDPCLEKARAWGLNLEELPSAKEEVEMIGKILSTAPLTGKKATKYEVLKRLSSVALVHIAAHGCMETGEIVLAGNPTRASHIPLQEDFLLRMSDVMRVKLRARMVVLSSCYSGRGEIKAEGVVGIARAFLGAGARSVLVSLWAIDDEATLEFMKSFYSRLAEGRSASESLNQAMKRLRESEKFCEVKHWAPFVLIGDDVTLYLAKGN